MTYEILHAAELAKMIPQIDVIFNEKKLSNFKRKNLHALPFELLRFIFYRYFQGQ